MLKVMERNRHVIETDLSTLVFYMKGGIDYNDAWLLTEKQRRIMSKVIEKHYEAMNPNKKEQL